MINLENMKICHRDAIFKTVRYSGTEMLNGLPELIYVLLLVSNTYKRFNNFSDTVHRNFSLVQGL